MNEINFDDYVFVPGGRRDRLKCLRCWRANLSPEIYDLGTVSSVGAAISGVEIHEAEHYV